MKKLLCLSLVLGAFMVTSAHAIPRPCDCFGGIDPYLSPTYWYLLDETGYPLQNGDWVYVAWKGSNGQIDSPNKSDPTCGDVTGDDLIIGEGSIYYGCFVITVTTYAPEDGQHPWVGEEIYCRIFNEPKYPTIATGWFCDSDQHAVGNFLGETFFAKFPGDPGYGSVCWAIASYPFVDLMSFEALGRDGEVLLEWKTASETDNFGFYIERSRDEVNFQRITEKAIPGAGNSETENTYTYVDRGLVNGTTYYYNLISVDMDGLEEVANESPVAATPEAHVPKDFALGQNYPNPFNPVTEITYTIPTDGHVTVKVYNVLGAEVATLVDMDQQAGSYTLFWDGHDYRDREAGSGIYFCQLNVGHLNKTIKMVLVK